MMGFHNTGSLTPPGGGGVEKTLKSLLEHIEQGEGGQEGFGKGKPFYCQHIKTTVYEERERGLA